MRLRARDAVDPIRGPRGRGHRYRWLHDEDDRDDGEEDAVDVDV